MKYFNFKKPGIIFVLTILTLSNSVLVVSQTVTKDDKNQYLYNEFSAANVKMKTGNIQSTELNFNTVSGKMVYRKDGNLYDMINTELIDTVYFTNYVFIPTGETFFEVLAKGPVSLFAQYQGSLIAPGSPSGYGGTSQTSSIKNYSSLTKSSGTYNLKLPDEYTVLLEKVYWVKQGAGFDSFVNERQFLKIFSSREDELKQFINKYKIKFTKQPDVLKLINYLNGSGK